MDANKKRKNSSNSIHLRKSFHMCDFICFNISCVGQQVDTFGGRPTWKAFLVLLLLNLVLLF